MAEAPTDRLFHGLSVEIKSQVAQKRVLRLFLAMLVYFLVPGAALLVAVHAIADPRGAAMVWFSMIYTLTNVIHLVADIRIQDARSDQVMLMTVLTLGGLLINQQALVWWQS